MSIFNSYIKLLEGKQVASCTFFVAAYASTSFMMFHVQSTAIGFESVFLMHKRQALSAYVRVCYNLRPPRKLSWCVTTISLWFIMFIYI